MKVLIHIRTNMTETKTIDVSNKRVNIPIIDGMHLDNERLTIKDLDRFPKNTMFLNEQVSPLVDDTIAKNKNIVFHSIKMTIDKWSDPGVWGWKFRFLWHGRGEDGRVMLLIVNDIFPTIHVRMPDDMKVDEFMSAVKQNITEWTMPTDPTVVLARRLVYYEHEKKEYAKIQCSNFADYDAILDKFKNVRRWIVADTRYAKRRFYMQACRANDINPAGFNTFRFQQRGNPYPQNIVSDIDEIFVVSIKDVCSININDIENCRDTLIFPHISDLNFDLETGSRVFGKALYPERTDTHCNIVGGTLRINKKDVFRFGLTTSEHALPVKGFVLMYCKTEVEMFLVLAHIIRKLRPAFISGYNIDDFDWNFVVTKLIHNNAVETFFSTIDFIIPDFSWLKKRNSNRSTVEYNEYVARHYMTRGTMKISADEVKCPVYYPHVISFVNFDEFNQLKRKHVSGKFSRKSLNHFLNFYGLPSKFDMDYPTMHDTYNDQLDVMEGKEKITDRHVRMITDEVVYCVFDTIAQLDLSDISSIRQNAFITAQQNKICVHDVIYYALGGIVIEKLITSAFEKGYIDSNEPRIAEQMMKYPGALVIHPPERGMSKPKPSVAQRVKNSPEWHDVTAEEAKIIEDAHFNRIHDPSSWILENNTDVRKKIIELTSKMFDEDYQTPTIPFDYHSMYPNIMAEGNLSLEKAIKPGEEEKMKALGVKTRLVDHEFNGIRVCSEFQIDDGDQTTRGLIPCEQYNLLQQRNTKKADLKRAKLVLLTIDKVNDNQKWAMQNARCDILNMEQLECKISMNSYYGKAGDRNNPLFMMAIACDTTLGGRKLLGMLVEICKDFGCSIQYGDTDSAYVKFAWTYYNDIVAKYFGGRIDIREYYEQLIAAAHLIGDKMELHINSTLDSRGYPFMRVEKERVGFPKMNIRCKRYALSNHTNPKKSSIGEDGSSELYMVGISEKLEKSKSGLFITLSKMMLDQLFNIYNERSAREIVTQIIAESFQKARDYEWDQELFIKRAQFKPDKKNPRIIKFLERLKTEGKRVPRAYEKFEYGYIQRDDIEYDVYGNKNKTARSDYMELYSDIIKDKLPIDFMVYMTGSIIGELGQYMCCDPDFIVHPIGDSDDDKFNAENATTKNGTEFIKMLCKQASATLDTKFTKPIYVKIFSHIKSHINSAIKKTSNMQNDHVNMAMNAYKKDGAMALYMIKVDKESEKAKMSIVNALVIYIKNDMKKVRKCHSSENSALSSKKLYIYAMSEAHQNNITRLNQLCKLIDTFNVDYHGFVKRQNDSIRKSLNLNRSIISYNDIIDARDNINQCKIDNVNFKPLDVDVFDECDKIVTNLIVYETRIKAFEIFRIRVRSMIEEDGLSGKTMDPTHVASDTMEAMSIVTLPSSVYDM
jgi:DNA polymerase elongation subunit (family B)